MRTVTITLPEDVAHLFEVRAAMDDMRLPEALSDLLTTLAHKFRQRAEPAKATA